MAGPSIEIFSRTWEILRIDVRNSAGCLAPLGLLGEGANDRQDACHDARHDWPKHLSAARGGAHRLALVFLVVETTAANETRTSFTHALTPSPNPSDYRGWLTRCSLSLYI